MSNYTPTIGIECHVQLKTKTKLFARVGNDAREANPNTLISHICVGMPGALPYLNERAVELAIRAAFALNTTPQKFSKFDRKHYFYPDLPKGYQISQYEHPIILGGHVDILVNGQTKKIGITRAHLEEDAGKNTHPNGADYSLVDLNRAGTPLLEIVSEPDIHSPEEAKAYAHELYLLMKYADVSDVDLYHGNMRFDVNVSLSKDINKLGTRSEVKNLNSFRSVENAVAYEINRQTELLEKGEQVVQETRGWDEAKQKTTTQRGKEEAHDYRYMPEPDVPPIILSNKQIDSLESELPELPPAIRKKMRVLDITPSAIEDILDLPDVIVKNILLNLTINDSKVARRIAFWFLGNPTTSTRLQLEHLPSLAKLQEFGKLNSSAADIIFLETIKTGEDPLVIAERLNLLQLSDEGEIDKIVKEVIDKNSQAADDVKNGELKAIGFLVGQVMAESKGKANPGIAQQIIKKHLGLEN